MTDRIRHRGPDDEGLWADVDAGIGLGHRRLSIIDLSQLGHQPMRSSEGRYLLTYNGEIYNHRELRAALDAAAPRAWRGHSDSETLVEGIAHWGLAETLRRCVGMFALAVWDVRERKLQLARDRFGEKPLYYGWVGGDFVFASELGAIRALPGFDNPVDRRAVRLLLARTYVPAPLSIFHDVYKLQPGCVLTVAPEARSSKPAVPPVPGAAAGPVRIDRYWSYRDVQLRGLAEPYGDEGEALRELEAALAKAVAGQAVADVPVGAFLSGGIDSSLVVALYQKYSAGPVRTYTIGFEEAGFNEAPFARRVAEHFGTEHHERIVTAREAQQVIPLLPFIYGEPFADSSQIPTHIVSRFAREQVKVALSGDGGDELFAGYDRYFGAAALWGNLKRVPRPLRAALGGTLGQLPPGAWDRMATLLPGRGRPHFGSKVQKALRTMQRATALDDVFATYLDEWSGHASPVIGGDQEPAECGFDMGPSGAPDMTRMMYCDAMAYLPDDILCKVDRASMAVSLETRAPFLDHGVAEVAARIPVAMKAGGGTGKQILRKLLYAEAPAELFARPKAGFGIPVGTWLKGPLRDWAEALLDRDRMAADGFFDADAVARRWQEHLRGERDATHGLWAILMFQAWREADRETAFREAA